MELQLLEFKRSDTVVIKSSKTVECIIFSISEQISKSIVEKINDKYK